MAHELSTRVLHAIQTHRLLTSGERVVVAVSGGADSVALLHLLISLPRSWRLSVHVAHLDHGLRPESSDDAEFVNSLAQRWQVPCTIERRDVRRRCAQEGWSLEDGARRVRYEFLLELAQRHSAGRLALAHTADDQAETVLLRLLRGSGLLGLGAMPPQRQLSGVALIRPLLGIWRLELLAYLRHVRVGFREDASNRDVRFVRNRIRHELLPLLEQRYNPHVKGLLTQLAEQSRWEYAYLEQAAQRQWRRTAKPTAEGGLRIAVDRFARQPKAVQRHLIRQAVRQLKGDLTAFEFKHWREVEQLFLDRPNGTIVHLPGGVRLRRHAGYVEARLEPSASAPADE
ncbi:MAG: tRNA lysidine(34) synthetase TilS [Candidatus Omnitrophica bacterium CG11_big_fil_rev_8_21_14_0_20_63_9]|nr:MAG: tRNA lysidine(34) synthetase TilS [Candidatus Omnitrophica bacterium CG11_big_fil_rev_8_21_14_0_20_63_9]